METNQAFTSQKVKLVVYITLADYHGKKYNKCDFFMQEDKNWMLYLISFQQQQRGEGA